MQSVYIGLLVALVLIVVIRFVAARQAKASKSAVEPEAKGRLLSALRQQSAVPVTDISQQMTSLVDQVDAPENDEPELEYNAASCWAACWPQTAGTPIERALKTMEMISDRLEHDWLEDEDNESFAAEFVPFFVEHGCESVEITRYFFNQTGLDIDQIIALWPADKRPDGEAWGEICRQLDLEIDSYDVAAMLDADDLTTAEWLKFFRVAGTRPFTILEGIDEANFEADDGDLVKELVAAGYQAQEILNALAEKDSASVAVQAGLEANLPISEIAMMLVTRQVDPDDLDHEMSNDDVPLRDRVRVLHAYLFPGTPTGAEATG